MKYSKNYQKRLSLLLSTALCIMILLILGSVAHAAPQGGQITQGSGRIEQSSSHTDIYQKSNFLATQWSSFNIAKHESAQAHQPDTASRLLIRVDGAGATNIAGRYTSNGITIIENQNGVQFSQGAVVNVGGLLATSARIKASEILVGGDYQGKGAAQNAQRTLVEPDALLDAGEKGRVIVWSDETTWFHGKIKAPNGFAEVSGKQNLAAVNLAEIEVGTLLLDPQDIVIGDTGTPITADIAADAAPTDGTLHIAASSINGFIGNLHLIASRDLTVNTHIIRTAGTAENQDLTLEAWGNLYINANINTGGGALRILVPQIRIVDGAYIFNREGISGPAGTIRFTTTRAIELVGGSITLDAYAHIPNPPGPSSNYIRLQPLPNNQNLTLRAAGDINIKMNINTGTGDLKLIAGEGETTGAINLNFYRINLKGNVITLTADTASEPWHFSTRLDITARNDLNINADLKAYDIVLNSLNGAINFGTSGTGPITLTAGSEIRLTAVNTPTASNRDLNLISGRHTSLNADINTGAHDLTLRAWWFIFGESSNAERSIMLAGNNITLSTPSWAYVLSRTVSHQDLTLQASGNLNINTNINAGTRSLTLIAGHGNTTGAINFSYNIPLQQSPMWHGRRTNQLIRLAGGAIALTADKAPAESNQNILIEAAGDLSINTDFNIGRGALLLEAGLGADQTGTLTFDADRFTITAASAALIQNGVLLNLPQLSLPVLADFVKETGASFEIEANIRAVRKITLNAGTGTITFAGTGAITLKALAITITAGNVDSGGRNLTLTAEGGTLTINSNINTGNGSLTLAIGREFNDNNGINFSTECAVELVGSTITFKCSGNLCVSSTPNNQNLTIRAANDINLNARIDVGTGDLKLIAGDGDTTGAINFGPSYHSTELRGREVTLTADAAPNPAFNRTLHALNISASNNININADIRVADIGLRAANGAINFGTSGSGPITLESVRRLFLTAAKTITSNRNLNLIAHDAITITIGIDTGAHDLTLTAGQLTLSSIYTKSPITLTGNNITLTSNPQYISSHISHPDLTIRARGDLNLNTSINAGTYSLTLIAGDGETTGAINFNHNIPLNRRNANAPITLAGSTITLTADKAPAASMLDLTIQAAGNININTDFNIVDNHNLAITSSEGTLTLNADIVDPYANVNLSAHNIILNSSILWGHNVSLTASATTADAIRTNNFIEIIAANTLAILANLNAGTNNIDLSGDNGIISNAAYTFTTEGTLSLSQNVALGANFPATIDTSDLNMTLLSDVAEQTVHNWMLAHGRNLSLNMEHPFGKIAIDHDIDLGSASLTLTGQVELSGTRTIQAGSIEFNNRITSYSDFTLIATEGDIVGNGHEIIAPSVTLSQTFAFSARAPFSFTQNMTSLIITTSGRQTIQPWMTTMDRSLSLNSSIITIGRQNIDIGAGNLTLNGRSRILLSGSNSRAIRAHKITLSGIVSGFLLTSAAITISALSDLSLSHDINIHKGQLVLEAGRGIVKNGVVQTGRIIFPQNQITITATSAILRQDAQSFPTAEPARFILSANVLPAVDYDGTQTQPTLSWATSFAFASAEFVIDTSASNTDFEVEALIARSQRIILNAGTGTISFAGVGAIELRAPIITITAGKVNLAGRHVQITTRNGTLTLHADLISAGALIINGSFGNIHLLGAQTLSGSILSITANQIKTTTAIDDTTLAHHNLTLTASAGDLTLASDVNIGTGALIVETNAQTSQINNGGSARTLTASSVSLTQHREFSSTSPFNYNAGTLNLTTSSAQTFRPWMVADNRHLTLNISNQTLKIESHIGYDTADLHLSAQSIILNNPSLIAVSGQNISLQALNVMAAHDFTINAMASLKIDSNINIGTNTLILNNYSDNGIVFKNNPTLTARKIELRQKPVFATTAPFTFGTDVEALELSITGQQVRQKISPWMVATNRDLTLNTTGAGGISINENINLGTGSLSLRADGAINFMTSSITVSADNITLISTAAAIASNQDLMITAHNNLSINTDINAGIGALTLIATNGAINFSASKAITLTGNKITLTAADAPAASNQNLTITAYTDFKIDTDINTGSGDLSLAAGIGDTTGAINFSTSKAITLTGNKITLAADTTPTAGNQNLTITAATDLNINTRLYVGTGNLSLTAGMGDTTGAINFNMTASTRLNGHNIALTADAEPLTSNQHLIILARNDLTINSDLDTGAKNLALFAGHQNSNGLGTFSIATAASVKLNGTVIRLKTQTIPSAGTANDLTITAQDSLELNAHLILVRGDALRKTKLTLIVGFLKNIEDASLFHLTADIITINQKKNSFGELFPQVSAQKLELLAAGKQLVYPWMVANGRSLSLTVYNQIKEDGSITEGEISVSSDYDLGTGDLTLHSFGKLAFTREATLSAANITLRSADQIQTNNNDLIINATGHVNINSNIGTGTGNLALTAGLGDLTTGVINFNKRSATTLDGNQITLTADATPTIPSNQNLTILARANLEIDTAINIGMGNLTLSAGLSDTTGKINFSTSKAITLAGREVLLTSAAQSTITSNQDLKVSAQGNLEIRTNIDTGTGNLTLIAGFGDSTTGTINFNKERTTILKGHHITFTADATPTMPSNQNLQILEMTELTMSRNTQINIGSGMLTIEFADNRSRTFLDIFESGSSFTAGNFRHPNLSCADPYCIRPDNGNNNNDDDDDESFFE